MIEHLALECCVPIENEIAMKIMKPYVYSNNVFTE